MKTMSHKLDKFDFGEHEGKTVREVIESDPSYILWLDREKIVKFPQEVLDNAEDNDDPLQGSWGWDGELDE